MISEGDTVVATTPQPFTILDDAPNVQVTLDPVNPPIVIPSNGGAFEFEIAITNNEAVPMGCHIWTDITFPNGLVCAPIVNVAVTIPVGTVSRLRPQQIPALAPPGMYSYNAYVGIYPNAVWSSSNFDFDKSEGTVGLQNGSWANHGEPFEFDKNQFSLNPSSFILHSVHPNPFNSTTTINFALAEASHVHLSIFNLQGRKVDELVKGIQEAGNHEVTWNAAGLPSGIYLYRIEAEDFSAVKKMVLMK